MPKMGPSRAHCAYNYAETPSGSRDGAEHANHVGQYRFSLVVTHGSGATIVAAYEEQRLRAVGPLSMAQDAEPAASRYEDRS